jgi:hypothetical protein
MLSLFNGTGRELFIDHLDGLEFANKSTLKSITLEQNQSIPLNVPSEHQTGGRLSVIEEQNHKRRQEFTVKIGDTVKTVSINRTWQRVYELAPSSNSQWPIQMLCDAKIENDRRSIILSSIARVFNNTTFPLLILDVNSTDQTKYNRITRIDINKDFYIPIDLLYKDSTSLISFAIDE